MDEAGKPVLPWLLLKLKRTKSGALEVRMRAPDGAKVMLQLSVGELLRKPMFVK